MSAPTFTRSTGSLTGGDPGTTVSGSIQVDGSNKMLLVGVLTYDAAPAYPTGITFNGSENFTRITDADLPADGSMYYDSSGRMSVWRLLAPTNTTANVTVTWAASPDAYAVVIMLFNNVNQTTPIADVKADIHLNAASATSASCAPTSTTNDLVVAMLGYYLDGTYTEGGSQTPRVTSDASTSESLIASTKAGASGTTTVSYTTPDSAISLFGITIQGTTSGPSLVSLSPADDTQNVGAIRTLVLTFDENVQAVSGNITVNETGGSTLYTISVADTSRVVFNTTTCTITLDAALPRGKNWNIQVANGAIEASGDSEDWTGITDTTTWSFDTFPVTLRAAGTEAYSASGGTTVAPSAPASVASGDWLIMLLGQKPSSANGGSATTPSGWFLAGSITGATDGDTGGYTTTLAADQGNTNLYCYFRQADGTGTDTPTVTVGTNNVCWARIWRLTHASDVGPILAITTGKDTAGGSVSITFAADPGVDAHDVIIAAMCIPTDVTTPAQFSSGALSQTGVTFGTVSEDIELDSGTGNDIGGVVYTARPTAGPSSAAPVLTATAGGTTTNVRGPGIFLRIRGSAALPGLLTSTPTFPTPTATPGSVTGNPPTAVSTTVFPSPSASASITASPVTAVSTPSFPTPSVDLSGGSGDVLPLLLTSTATFPAPTGTPGDVQGSPSTLTSSSVLSVPTVTAITTPLPPLGGSTPTFPAPSAAAGSVTASPPKHTSTPSFDVPSVGFASPLHLNVHASGRYLVNDVGTPYFFNGDAAWSLIVQTSGSDPTVYLDAMQALGVTAILVNLFDRVFGGPENAMGVAPFTTPDDIRTLDTDYFDHVDTVLEAAAERGIVVWLCHFYSGIGGGSEGFYNVSMVPRSTGDITTFGAAIGTALGHHPNIVWVQSGDYTPASQTKINALMDGIRSTELVRHLVTYHPDPNSSPRDVSGVTTLDLSYEYWYVDAVSTDGLSSDLAAAYNKSPAKPFFLGETFYANRDSGQQPDARWLRAQHIAAALYGGGLGFPGDEHRWHFSAGPPDWTTTLDGEFTLCYAAFSAAFSTRRWYDLVPDLSSALITAGRGTIGTEDYVPAALTSDGKFGAAYTYTGASFTVSLAQFTATVTAQWCDPTTGQLYAATGSPFTNSGTHAFNAGSERGNNANGDADWILLLETNPTQTASPSAHTSTPTFGAPTAFIPQSASAPLDTSTPVIPLPTGTVGAVTASPPLGGSTPVFPAPTGQLGAVTGLPSTLVDSAVLPVPDVTPGAVTAFPPTDVSTPTFPTPAASGSLTASPIPATSTPTFGQPIVSGENELVGAPETLVSTPVLPSPTGTPGAVTGSPPLLSSSPSFPSPSASATITANLPLLQSIAEYFSPTGSLGDVTASPPALVSTAGILLPTVFNETVFAFPTTLGVVVVLPTVVVVAVGPTQGPVRGTDLVRVYDYTGGTVEWTSTIRGADADVEDE